MLPSHLRYTVEHEWALVTESGSIRFGITDYAQNSLGDVVFVTAPEIDATVAAGQPCGEVESTKSVADIFAPVAGIITAANEVIVTAPEIINSDPYGRGWIAEITATSPDPLAGLLTADEYRDLIGSD